MATDAAQIGMPLLYKELVPLSSQIHGDWRIRSAETLPELHTVHAVPLLAEEFIQAQRFYPIVFSHGAEPVPLALMALNEGMNVFVDRDGRFPDEYYVPAYIRRYPFVLAKLRQDSDDLSLCVDPTSPICGPSGEGDPVFEGEGPSERTRAILGFCETFEESSQTTSAFMRELIDAKLLGDGEFSVQPEGAPAPYLYRGFQLITEERVKEMRGDVARKLIQNGALPLIYAHLFSLQKMGEVFARQGAQGKLPPPNGPMG